MNFSFPNPYFTTIWFHLNLANSINWKAGQKDSCWNEWLFHRSILVCLNLKNNVYVFCGTEIYLLHILLKLKTTLLFLKNKMSLV